MAADRMIIEELYDYHRDELLDRQVHALEMLDEELEYCMLAVRQSDVNEIHNRLVNETEVLDQLSIAELQHRENLIQSCWRTCGEDLSLEQIESLYALHVAVNSRIEELIRNGHNVSGDDEE